MIGVIINIRFKQIYRSIKYIGLFRSIFLSGLLTFISFILFKQTEIFPNVYYLSCFYLILISIIQVKRQDKLFLKSNFNNSKLIYFIEYLILIIPLIVCLTYHSHWLLTFILFPTLFLISSIDFKIKQRDLNTKIQNYIPDACFEWKAGLRKTLLFLVPLWIISLSTSFFIGSVPIAIIIFGLISLGFYENSETYQMIMAYEMSPRRFLAHKIKLQVVIFSIIIIPLIISFIIFHHEYWYIPLVEYLILMSLNIYFTLVKYAFYEPNNKSSSTGIYKILGLLGVFIPLLLPIVWLLSPWFYIKSIQNLNFYLHDYN